MSPLPAAAAQSARPRPPRGLGHTVAHQTPLSAAVALTGAAAIGVLVLGTVAVISSYGWTPSANLAAGIESTAQAVVLWIALALGLAAAGVGWGVYRLLPSKAAREGATIGAVLGSQAAAFGALLLWASRTADVPRFTRVFFEFALLGDFWQRFIRAAGNTVVLAAGGQTLGIVLGLVFAVFAVSNRRVVRAPARVYINFFRGTPLLWQLQFFFFGLVLGLRIGMTAYQTAILVLGLNAGAYTAEIFRAGIQSIERGQFEAARSLGMGYLQALRYVVLPQAFRRVIPPLTNEFVILIKDTSLVAVLGLTFAQQELMATSRDIYQQTFNATPYLAAAAGYLAITLPLIRVVSWLERRLRSGLTGIGA
jgi:His/Glu/Gln/Arg/opine family amino acid ABC transporter permease subunit